MNDSGCEYELFDVECTAEFLRGFAAGWSATRAAGGAPATDACFVPQAHGVAIDTLRTKVVEALRPGDWAHLLVRAGDAEACAAALAPAARIRARHRIGGASFDFGFEILARAEADRVRELFAAPPEGVRVTWTAAPTEKVDPGERGEGMYAPEYEYVFRGRGTAAGRVDAILAFHRRLRRHERIQAQDVRLVRAT